MEPGRTFFNSLLWVQHWHEKKWNDLHRCKLSHWSACGIFATHASKAHGNFYSLPEGFADNTRLVRLNKPSMASSCAILKVRIAMFCKAFLNKFCDKLSYIGDNGLEIRMRIISAGRRGEILFLNAAGRARSTGTRKWLMISFEYCKDTVWMARRREAQEIWMGWTAVLLNLHGELAWGTWMPTTGRPYLLTGLGSMA